MSLEEHLVNLNELNIEDENGIGGNATVLAIFTFTYTPGTPRGP